MSVLQYSEGLNKFIKFLERHVYDDFLKYNPVDLWFSSLSYSKVCSVLFNSIMHACLHSRAVDFTCTGPI